MNFESITTSQADVIEFLATKYRFFDEGWQKPEDIRNGFEECFKQVRNYRLVYSFRYSGPGSTVYTMSELATDLQKGKKLAEHTTPNGTPRLAEDYMTPWRLEMWMNEMISEMSQRREFDKIFDREIFTVLGWFSGWFSDYTNRDSSWNKKNCLMAIDIMWRLLEANQRGKSFGDIETLKEFLVAEAESQEIPDEEASTDEI
jgi:hypothetical protein